MKIKNSGQSLIEMEVFDWGVGNSNCRSGLMVKPQR